ncbi:polysaccharide deacetylase family protein [Streptomyces sp. HB132]|uniref:polysaccharide deacetylase family protein n=1 Tax=Streptomyces sp. HB132 TaxID=767388 RepID=UPI001961D04C|nr:polysaccharide deacetylase family protein [Streptomyces sp. HB132]MBM7442031.1 peptidoglycan/xylan/chitin deacetylase (PgdA/CDA1 family) [Streptomyces sp. HB132]
MQHRRTAMPRRGALRAAAGLVLGGTSAAGCARDAPSRSTAGKAQEGEGDRRGREAFGAVRQGVAPRRLAGQPVQIEHGPRASPRVALTFHGRGDPALARAVLAQAERAGARLTVLAVGDWLDRNPGMARRILDGGHDLGNHTQGHLDINAMDETRAYEEITGCARRLRRLTGSIGTWFRPSRARHATPLVQELAQRAGYPHVLSYDVDSLDFTSPGVAAVTRKVAGELRNGSVVSLHFGYRDTVAALPLLLTEIDRRRLRAVTATELLT